MADSRLLRIGELSKRSGVSPELLRAWERRYGLLQPTRSAGGLRLYSSSDVERIRLMQQQLAEGVAAAEAAAATTSGIVDVQAAPPRPTLATLRVQLADALDRFDEPRAQTILDRLLAVTTVEALLSDVVLPYLRELGERWARGDASVAQEHFATAVLRGRLLGIARGWGLSIGPATVLACLPGEQHDLGLITFGLALHARGWRIYYLGPDTPIETVDDTSRRVEPDLVVLSALGEERVKPVIGQLRALAAHQRLALALAGATPSYLSESDGVLMLTGDPITEATRVTALARDDAFPAPRDRRRPGRDALRRAPSFACRFPPERPRR